MKTKIATVFTALMLLTLPLWAQPAAPTNVHVVAGLVSATVNWSDPLAYTKPPGIAVTLPNETTATKYWVDFDSGTGSTCSQGSPCDSFGDLCGKSGFSGTGAYVYAKGTGWGTGTFNPASNCFGATGSEIVVKPWPAGSPGCSSPCTVTFQSGGNMVFEGSKIHHWIFDGGENLQIIIEMNTSSPGGFLINADDLTFYRVHGKCASGTGSDAQAIFKGSAGVTVNFKLINSELETCLGGSNVQRIGVYLGGSSCNDGSAGFTNAEILNNVFRSLGGEAIELNPRTASSGILIAGNVFHDIGQQSCGGGRDCRGPVTIDGPSCGGSSSGVIIKNNLIWDTGAGFWIQGGGAVPSVLVGNTIYDYGVGTASGTCQGAFCSNTGSSSDAAIIRDNIAYPTNGRNPLQDIVGSFATVTHNATITGETFGSSSQTLDSADFTSIDPNNAGFFKLVSGSNAKGTGVTVSGLTTDYQTTTRPSPPSIGAFEAP